jgi:hypothetical protein
MLPIQMGCSVTAAMHPPSSDRPSRSIGIERHMRSHLLASAPAPAEQRRCSAPPSRLAPHSCAVQQLQYALSH